MSADQLVFVDSNVLLYSVDDRNAAKQRMAHQWMDALWASRRGRLSWQVLNEYYANATGKLRADPELARRTVEWLAEWADVDSGINLLRRAWHWVDDTGVNYWDSLIIASAERSGCRYLLSEDFQSGRKYGTITVVNPFRHAADEFLVI